jgi:hypothetical protein
VTSPIGLTFLPMARYFRSCCFLLKATSSKQLCGRVPVDTGVPPPSCFYQSVRATVARVVSVFTSMAPTLCAVSFCIPEGGQPLHNVQLLPVTQWKSRLLASRTLV